METENPITDDDAAVDAVVIGGGIIGLTIAEKLSSEGYSVTLVEKERIAAGASEGNAAALAFSDIMPLASPGIIRKSIKWFLDPLGPFTVVPQDLPKTLSWLLRFLKASHPTQFKQSISVQAKLMELSKASFPEMLSRTGLASMVRSNGALHLYQSLPFYRNDLSSWEFRKQHDIEFQTYEGEALHNFQPGLSKAFVAGIFVPAWQSVSNPGDFCHALHEHITKRGVKTHFAAVDDIHSSDLETIIQLSDGNRLNARKTIIAAGPWSATISSKLGDKVPMIGERGYNTTLPDSVLDKSIDRTLVFSEHGFVFTPLKDGYRIGGASEIARLERSPNYRRSEVMAKKARQFLPHMKMHDGKNWMGQRPSIPDTLPVIDYSSSSNNIIYAFGHGHLGLTQSTATAQLVSELFENKNTSMDIAPLRVSRF